MGIYGLHSVMGISPIKIYMDEMNVYEMWKQKINSERDEV